MRNHRPDLQKGLGQLIWKDGSGRARAELLEDDEQNGWDCRGSYDHVVLEHFPLRSLECYLIKMHRGDVVVKDKMVSNRYWRTRNKSADTTSDMRAGLARMRAEYDTLLQDPELARLQSFAEAAHQKRINAISGEPLFVERKTWIYTEAWHEEYPQEAKQYISADNETS